MLKVEIYTDGACSGNPGPGGWGAYLKYGDVTKDISGYELETTNNRMEMIAAIEALSILKRKCIVELYTDSVYLKNGMTIWLPEWIANGWRKKHRGEVKNLELWQKLHEISNYHNIMWYWVKGHSDNYGNQRADSLAVRARKQAEEIKKCQ